MSRGRRGLHHRSEDATRAALYGRLEAGLGQGPTTALAESFDATLRREVLPNYLPPGPSCCRYPSPVPYESGYAATLRSVA